MTMKTYTMTDEQHESLLASCKPVPMIMLQCGTPPSQQENANRAWETLGVEMGFDHMTVQQVHGQPATVFTAEPVSRYDEILKESHDSFKGKDKSMRDSFAAGYLAQWVCRLEQDLKEAKERLSKHTHTY